MVVKMNTKPKTKRISKNQTPSVMRDVLIALLPAAAVGIYNYKGQAVAIIISAIIASVVTEAVWQKLCKKKISIGDMSAAVTGLILALILPVHVPLWIPVAGSVFATLIVKGFFGGEGSNFMNPAIAAKVFLMTSWAAVMIKPVAETVSKVTDKAAQAVSSATGAAVETVSSASGAAETVSSASGAAEAVTSASQTVAGAAAKLPSLWDTFLFQAGGNIGELSVAALVIGGLYLIVRRVISYRIPLSFLATAAFMSWFIGGKEGFFTGDPIRTSITGVLAFAVFFMANDRTTSPQGVLPQIVFGIGCGVFGTVFRVYGYNGEGAYYAILVMNLFVPLLEKLSNIRLGFLNSRREAV